MTRIVAVAIGGLMALFGVARVDFPAIGRHVAEQATYLPDQGAAVDMAVLFRPGQH